MNKKRGIFILLLALIGFLSWHFLAKPYQHRLRFTTKDSPGLVYNNLLSWKFVKGLPDSSAVSTALNIPFSRVEQLVTIKDSSFTYVWEIEKTKDSRTQVTAYISDDTNGFYQNLNALTKGTDFFKRNIGTVESLGNEWVAYRSKYRIGEAKKDSLAIKFSAYITVESKVNEKAGSMMRNIADVMGFINSNDLELDGDPFLEVTRWNLEQQTIQYDFCFPIKKADSLPQSDLVKYKESRSINALVTSFNGNYSIADKAWYSLIDYAQQNNIPIEMLPIEVYLDDPHSGGDALQWEAKVYMPIK